MVTDLTKTLYLLSVRARRRGIIQKFKPNGENWKFSDKHFKYDKKKEDAKDWLEQKIEKH